MHEGQAHHCHPKCRPRGRFWHMIGCASWPMASPVGGAPCVSTNKGGTPTPPNGRRMTDLIDRDEKPSPVRWLPWQRLRLFTSVIVASRSPRAWVVHSIGGPGRQLYRKHPRRDTWVIWPINAACTRPSFMSGALFPSLLLAFHDSVTQSFSATLSATNSFLSLTTAKRFSLFYLFIFPRSIP